MKILNKVLSMMIAVMLMVTPVSVQAATASPHLIAIASSNVTVKIPSVTYNGKKQTANITCVVVVNGKTLVQGTDYILTTSGSKSAKKAGSYTVNAVVTGKGHYTGKVTKNVTFKIKKKAQKITVTPKKKTITVSSLKKNGPTTFKLKVKNSKTTLVYKEKAKYITISKKGKVKVSKGVKRKVHIIKVYAKATKNYKKSKVKTIRVIVK